MIHQSLYLAKSTASGVLYDGRNPAHRADILRYRDTLVCPACGHPVHKYSLRLQEGVVTFKHVHADAACPYSMETLKSAALAALVAVVSLDDLQAWLQRAKMGQWPKDWLTLELAPIIDAIRYDRGYASRAIYFRFGEFPATDRDRCHLRLNGRALKRRSGFDCYDFDD